MAGVGETFEHFGDEAKKLPWWAWIVLAVVVFVLFQHFFSSSSGTTTNAPSADQTALADTVPGVAGDTSTSGSSSSSPPPAVNPIPVMPGPQSGNPGMREGPQPPGPVGPNPAPRRNPTPPPAPAPAKPPYVVQSGDTLSEIASKERVSEPALYSTNAGVIESTARAHGFGSSDNGHWIFPGEQLVIP